MHNMLNLSMVYFPYVVMGVGQAVMAGTKVSVSKDNRHEEHRGRRVTSKIIRPISSSIKDRSMSGPPLLLPS